LKVCKTNLRPHKKKGVEIQLSGDCTELVEDIMKNMGPYTQNWIKSKMVIVENEADVTVNVEE